MTICPKKPRVHSFIFWQSIDYFQFQLCKNYKWANGWTSITWFFSNSLHIKANQFLSNFRWCATTINAIFWSVGDSWFSSSTWRDKSGVHCWIYTKLRYMGDSYLNQRGHRERIFFSRKKAYEGPTIECEPTTIHSDVFLYCWRRMLEMYVFIHASGLCRALFSVEVKVHPSNCLSFLWDCQYWKAARIGWHVDQSWADNVGYCFQNSTIYLLRTRGLGSYFWNAFLFIIVVNSCIFFTIKTMILKINSLLDLSYLFTIFKSSKAITKSFFIQNISLLHDNIKIITIIRLLTQTSFWHHSFLSLLLFRPVLFDNICRSISITI